jgi:hypothetical protein
MMIEPITEMRTGGAWLCYDQLLISASITSGDTSGTVSQSLIKNTYERWRPIAGATTAKFQMGSVASINFVAIAAHNLKGESLVISTAATVGGALTTRTAITVTSNEPFILTFDSVEAQEVAITATLSANKEIGVIYAGEYLVMPEPIYGGHDPIALNPDTEYQNNISESGQFLGRNIIRNGTKSSFAWQRLKPEFVRGDFELFAKSARRYPFFIKWRPDMFPTEDTFGFTTSDIKTSNMGGGHDRMKVSFEMRGHRDLE